VCVFIRVSARACINIDICIVFLKNNLVQNELKLSFFHGDNTIFYDGVKH
jgi:hypothetical protein